ncbi:plasmid stabilization protein ParE [Geomonas sp. Red276]
MAGFSLTKKAVTDLKDIGRYTEKKWGRDQRNRYLSMLDTCFQQLAKHPEIGKDSGYIREGYRKLVAGSHLIFYRQFSDGSVQVVRILHKSMDVESRLTET